MYGQQVAEFFLPRKKWVIPWFNRFFLIGCFVGCLADLSIIWMGADIINACMLLPNLVALILLSPVVLGETNRYFAKKRF